VTKQPRQWGLLMTIRQIFPDKTEASRFFRQICAGGACLHLRAQQRVPVPPANEVIMLREGMLAVDAMPTKGKLQVLDFLVAGDVVSASTVLATPRVSLRAITTASLVALESAGASQNGSDHDYWPFLMAQCTNQLARAYVHQLMVGRLETEPRVASFILALALRNTHENTRSITVSLPMSRDDIANYLVINCDTLSRTMMKFCDSGLIERKSRHAVRIVDLEALKKKTPLASLISTVFMNNDEHSEIIRLPGPETMSFTSKFESPCAILPASIVARPGSEHPSAARGGW
jgi:CRP/FNR family transcriptional regulator, anaerobic regulatory protein